MDQAGVLVHADVDFHAEVPLVAFFGLMHLRIPIPILVLGGAGSRDQGGIDDRALLHSHASLLEMAFNRLKDLLSEFVLLKQVAEGQDCCLIGDSVANQVNPREAAHGRYLNQSLFHAWTAEAVPLLHQVNSQHCRQWIGRAASFLACFWIARLDQFQKGLPWNYLLHFGQELLAFSPFFGRGLLVIGETQLLAACDSWPTLLIESFEIQTFA